MKKRLADICIVLLFCSFLGAMLLLFCLLPKEKFSEKEKRYLAPAPVFRWSTLASGRFSSDAETYAAEHLPGRDFLVGLSAELELLAGRQSAKEILRGKSGRLYERPAEMDAHAVERKMAAINGFAEAAGQPVDLLLVPEAGYLLADDLPALADPYVDDAIFAAVSEEAGEGLRLVDLRAAFAENDPAPLYYATDHHWTSRGAWLGASRYAETAGRQLPADSSYTITKIPGFTGTTWSRSALWLTPSEPLELWDSGGSYSVENEDRPGVHEGLFYTEHLDEADKYPVYLDGNHSLVRIEGRGEGRLLVIRDSFASCAACFLADGWEELVLVDLRYFRAPVSELLEEGFDNILVLYGLRNFMTDSNIVRLE